MNLDVNYALAAIAILILTGYFGYLFTAKLDLVVYLISIEIIFLALGLFLVHIGHAIDNLEGSFLTLILLPLAGGEAALGLGLLLTYSRRAS